MEKCFFIIMEIKKMKKLLPPILFYLFIPVMGIVCWALGFEHYVVYPYNLFGIPFLLFGVFLAVASKKMFAKLETNVNTFDKPDKLVTKGFYRFSRNPMYLGMVLGLLGVALLYQGSISSFAIVVVFFLITDLWYIRYEERDMKLVFGDEYKAYCAKTRRWV